MRDLRYPNNRLSTDQRRRLVNQYQQGDFLKDLSAEFGIDVQTVKRQLKQAGVELRPWPALSDEQALRLAQEYLETEIPIAKLAERYGVGYGTVRRTFAAMGVQARSRGRRSRS